MIRLRTLSALIVVLSLTPVLEGQEKAAPAWNVDRSLSVSPQGAPVPALKYRLLPLSSDLKEGNAVPIYLRLMHERDDAARKYLTETPRTWNGMPVEKIPLDEARAFIQKYHYLLRQLEVGARRKTAEWNYTLDEPDPIGLLLPDAQSMRNYEPMILLQARVALAQGDFAAGAHHLETGFAFARHVADGPTLIHKLIGFALAMQFVGGVGDFIDRPDAPNLYWALTALPRPLIDIRGPMEWEYNMVELQVPELADTDRERTPQQWDEVLRRVRTALWRMDELPNGKPRHTDWFPKESSPNDPAAKSPDLPAARQYVARTKGLTADKVEAMPPAQVLLLYMVGTYHEDRDNAYRAAYLPPTQARPMFEAALKQLRDSPATEGHLPARMLLSGLDRILVTQARVERNLAALRLIEALRMYAAAHGGSLPEKLGDITEVPVPNDPGTEKPFEYHRDGDTATIISQLPGEPSSKSGIRYRVTVRKK
jgi:hypothetical protein